MLLVALLTLAIARPAGPGMEVLEAAIGAYRDAPAIVDAMSYEVRMPGSEVQRGSGRVVLASGGASFTTDGLVSMARGDEFYFGDENPNGAYVKTGLGKGYADALSRVTGSSLNIPTPPHMFMREGAPPDVVINAYGFGILQDAALESHAVIEEEGAELDRLEFKASNGSLTLRIDRGTRFIVRADLVASPPGTEGELAAVFRFTPEAVPDDPALLAFDESMRRRVRSVSVFVRAGPSVGQTVPDLRLLRPDGSEFHISEHAGRLVVLEFWASWCGGCRLSLPAFDRVADWAGREGVRAEFLAVNSQETQPPERLRETASMWWAQLRVGVPWVSDPDNAASEALNISSFPTLVVISPEREVLYTHSGYNPELERELKKVLRAHAP